MPQQPLARFEDSRSEAIEQGHADMQLHNLALERARSHPFAQSLEAVHLRLHKAAPVVATPLLPDAATQALTRLNSLVALRRAWTGLFPVASVLARRDHRHRLAFGDGVQAVPRVVGAIGTDAFDGLVGGNLGQQLEQHRRISDGIAGHLDGAYLQRLCVDAQVDLAPLTPVLGTMLFAFALAFAKELHACAVHQQLQRRLARLVAQLDLQGLLASADRAEVRYRPVQLGQSQQACEPCPGLGARAGRTGT